MGTDVESREQGTLNRWKVEWLNRENEERRMKANIERPTSNVQRPTGLEQACENGSWLNR
jgi:hypothetical protein